MKAIHNARKAVIEKIITVFIPTKIQNESNSQQALETLEALHNCIYPYKDTK